MLDLTELRHVFKGEAPAQSKPTGLGFAQILRGGKPAPQTVAKAAPLLQSIAKAAPVQSIAKPNQPLRQGRGRLDQGHRDRHRPDPAGAGLQGRRPAAAAPASGRGTPAARACTESTPTGHASTAPRREHPQSARQTLPRYRHPQGVAGRNRQRTGTTPKGRRTGAVQRQAQRLCTDRTDPTRSSSTGWPWGCVEPPQSWCSTGCAASGRH